MEWGPDRVKLGRQAIRGMSCRWRWSSTASRKLVSLHRRISIIYRWLAGPRLHQLILPSLEIVRWGRYRPPRYKPNSYKISRCLNKRLEWKRTNFNHSQIFRPSKPLFKKRAIFQTFLKRKISINLLKKPLMIIILATIVWTMEGIVLNERHNLWTIESIACCINLSIQSYPGKRALPKKKDSPTLHTRYLILRIKSSRKASTMRILLARISKSRIWSMGWLMIIQLIWLQLLP